MNDSSRHSWWDRAERAGRALETWLIVALLGGLIIFASAQIVLRNVFSMGLTWSDGLVRILVLWLALIGAVAACRDGRHITMGALARWLPARMQAWAGLLADGFGAIVCSALAWFSLQFVLDSHEYGDMLLGDWPAWWFQVVMPVAFGLMAYQFLLRTLRRVFIGSVPTGGH